MGARRRVEPVDVVVATALALAAQAEIWAPDWVPGMGAVDGSKPVLAVTALVMTVPLAVQRTWPLWCCGLVLGAACAQQLVTTPTEGLSSLAAMLLASYAVSANGGTRSSAVGVGMIVATSVIVGGSDLAFLLLLMLAAWVMGMLVSYRTHEVADLQSDRQTLIEERHLAAARGAAQERRRIARELHDVVAHRVSVMVVQAQAADALLDSSPTKAREAVLAVEGAGRQALAELRSLLGLLRAADDQADENAALTPSPGLSDIEALVTQARAAGMPITLSHEGEPRQVSEVIGAAAYRVVQEAITNVLKHGARAATHVRVAFECDRLELLVTDDGPTGNGTEPGYGLAGMRERVDFVGGSLVTGPGSDGGFTVHASLPLPEASE